MFARRAADIAGPHHSGATLAASFSFDTTTSCETSNSINDLSEIAYHSEAWTEIGIAEMRPFIVAGCNLIVKNRDKARLPRKRNYILSLAKTLAAVVEDFIELPENREQPYRDLWPRFYAYLDFLDLDLKEIGGQYEYNAGGEKRRFINFTQFCRLVLRARNAAAS